ncbi:MULTISPECIES: [Fe-Fe] hydrogenase large subunit C-terminal domain-containing protein [unclassified Clostridium]|uniref:[Fe-Fe] hydrogenase large subunit C-terminal domain-containing protein n=1 Tax=unclassified Clostridium TaxID=2614128 RepID=UPI00052E1A36|nr:MULTISPECIES: [Fe-Fe] hydrogenase large subunit C-terminal domain-containing protein [unclassified Clostridium]KGK89237.1 iron hydrogenase [Clostridium sp. HMP27]
MHKSYQDLFKKLVKAHYDGNLKIEINSLFSDPEVNKDKLGRVISSLCGVEVKFDDNYIDNLTKAIENYSPSQRVVFKIEDCIDDCKNPEDCLCHQACPISAILSDPTNKKIYINDELCLDCGMCIDSCPEGTILDNSEFIPLISLLKSGAPVIVSVAPAIVGQFGEGVTIHKLRTAFKKMGFSDMIETAFFADMLTLKEAVEYDHFVQDEKDFMITSCCCPMWVGMLRKVYADLVKHVSPSVSPMIASGRILKALNPDCKVVFVGPCIAKKAEAREKDIEGAIDFVLTFAEVKDIFDALGIDPDELQEDECSEYASRGGRLYARTGGVSLAVGEAIERLFPEKYKYLKTVQGNGVRECKELLNKLKDGEFTANFIEGMGCIGGCVGGPKALLPHEQGRELVNSFADKSEIKVAIDSECMGALLQKIDINSIEDFKDNVKIRIFEREF